MQLQPPAVANSSNSSSGQLDAAQQQQQQQGSSDNAFSDSNTSSTTQAQAADNKSPLEMLLSAVANRWQEMRQLGPSYASGDVAGGQSGPSGSFVDVRAAWQELMAQLQQQQPQLVSSWSCSSLGVVHCAALLMAVSRLMQQLLVQQHVT
jgi:hypothetical protein